MKRIADKVIKDPAIHAFEVETEKTRFATPKVMPIRELQELTRMSIVNQNQDVGAAYTLARAALVLAEIRGAQNLVELATSFMVGIYEEQLAGLDFNYRAFFGTLGREDSYVEDLLDGNGKVDAKKWHDRLRELYLALGHSEANFNALMRVFGYVKTYQGLDGEKSPLKEGSALIDSIIAGLSRKLGRGEVNDKLVILIGKGFPVEVDGEVKDAKGWIADRASTSMAARQVHEFYNRIWPLMGYGLEDEED